MVDVITTVHFPDVEAVYFRSLLDFLYSGQTCVHANDVEHLHDLLDLLQIKPGVWRTSSKDGGGKSLPGEKVEVLSSRLYTETPLSEQSCGSSMESANSSSQQQQPRIDINSNERVDATSKQRRDSLDSSPGSVDRGGGRLSVKRERMTIVGDDEQRDMRHLDDLDLDDDIEEEQLDKKGNYNSVHAQHMHHHGGLEHRDEDERLEGRHSGDGDDDDDEEEERMRHRRSDSLDRDMICERRRSSSSDPVNLSLGMRDRDEDSNDGHIDVETIGTAPSKVRIE